MDPSVKPRVSAGRGSLRPQKLRIGEAGHRRTGSARPGPVTGLCYQKMRAPSRTGERKEENAKTGNVGRPEDGNKRREEKAAEYGSGSSVSSRTRTFRMTPGGHASPAPEPRPDTAPGLCRRSRFLFLPAAQHSPRPCPEITGYTPPRSPQGMEAAGPAEIAKIAFHSPCKPWGGALVRFLHGMHGGSECPAAARGPRVRSVTHSHPSGRGGSVRDRGGHREQGSFSLSFPLCILINP